MSTSSCSLRSTPIFYRISILCAFSLVVSWNCCLEFICEQLLVFWMNLLAFFALLIFLITSTEAKNDPPPGEIEVNNNVEDDTWYIYYKTFAGNRIGFMEFTSPIWHTDGDIYIHDFKVDTSQHRKGIGTIIINHFLEKLLPGYPEVKTVSLTIVPGYTSEQAAPFFKSVGFEWDEKDEAKRKKDENYGMSLLLTAPKSKSKTGSKRQRKHGENARVRKTDKKRRL